MKELRIAELRAAEPVGDSSLILNGRPIVYDQPTTIKAPFGEYVEIIKRGALDKADLSDIRLLYNHDMSKIPLARTPKTMSFALDSAGLTMRAELPETEEGKSVYTAVRRRDLSGMSFAFKVPEGGSQFDAKTNTRTITKIEKVYEFSICPFPAYPQTSVEARAAIESSWEMLKSAERQALKIKINQLLMRRV
ncbi:HK97 family phage prohead protease [Bacillus thuringiensis]|uniref:Peptidase U35 n=1 Tax=Bacillus thuringiensis TaxID=1428 RepID=A0A9X6Q400_BACTU|nr:MULTISPECIES: HK97 family phage prohead protease [Bacillus cereus group]MDA2615814.1 HK97 family phage prohead protease [Bacillus cereus]MEB8819082.1 HK97 family phage prohead protease [Bacillus cereus]MEB8973108.1 HK97 family phage prohead protease [Bacillus cereus]MEB9135877.1 HK97 family phage prohead protease [Bacillus cereus]MEB9513103.1 HK97 family phage prohead protease [Bacillus cereus]